MSRLKIALSKGALFGPSIDFLRGAGLDLDGIESDTRRLSFATPAADFVIARPTDVPTYVEHGAVDIGLVGSDVLMENAASVFELLDLGIGRCRFVLAASADAADITTRYRQLGETRIATKYPNVTARYLAGRGVQADVIKLYGSIELAPALGLADQIVDLSSTGRTLAENNLVVLDVIAEVSCRLIANYVAYKLKSAEVRQLVGRLRKVNPDA